jgi:hypothetical protein
MTPDPTLATAGELRTFVADDNLTETQAALALQLATSLVQAATRQRLVAVTGDVVELTPSRSRCLRLPEHPVTAVAKVEVMQYGAFDWLPYTPDAWQLHGNQLWTAWQWDHTPWSRNAFVRVTYDHGFATVPDDLKAVALGIASRLVTNPSGVRSEQIGSYSYTLATDGQAVALTRYEADVCNRYRQNTYAMAR